MHAADDHSCISNQAIANLQPLSSWYGVVLAEIAVRTSMWNKGFPE